MTDQDTPPDFSLGEWRSLQAEMQQLRYRADRSDDKLDALGGKIDTLSVSIEGLINAWRAGKGIAFVVKMGLGLIILIAAAGAAFHQIERWFR